MTQKELADRLGVTNKAVSKWETGQGMPDISVLLELARVLEVPVEEILRGGSKESAYETVGETNPLYVIEKSDQKKQINFQKTCSLGGYLSEGAGWVLLVLGVLCLALQVWFLLNRGRYQIEYMAWWMFYVVNAGALLFLLLGGICVRRLRRFALKPAVAAVSQSSPVTATSVAEGIEVKEMDRVRRMIADHMVMSKHTSPHVTTLVEVDMTKLVKWREKNKEAFFKREGVKLTYMPAITEATAKALVAYPQVNVSVEGYNILFKKHINVGIAVSQNDGNLIVPVVHDADRLNLSGLAIAIDGLAAKARINKLMPDDIAGGTFTITNFGTFKSLFGTPIINQPQVAILGVGVIEKKPAVMETPEGDVIAIRHKMYLSLSYDHRVVDGSLGGNFLYFIKNYLENWNE